MVDGDRTVFTIKPFFWIEIAQRSRQGRSHSRSRTPQTEWFVRTALDPDFDGVVKTLARVGQAVDAVYQLVCT